MRVNCHVCAGGWEFPDASRVARCTSCAVLALPPAAGGLFGTPDTSEPDDFTILGVPSGADETTLRAAWARFLSKVPADRYPQAFRQGRAAYDRLTALRTAPRIVRQYELSGGCLACDTLRGYGFRTCLVCSGELTRTGADPHRREQVEVANAQVKAALREAEARWGAGRSAELRAAAERGLGVADLSPRARARFALLLGHAEASEGHASEAHAQWTLAMSDLEEGVEARGCLAILAYGRADFEETIHFLGVERAERDPTLAILRGAACHAAGRLLDAEASASLVGEGAGATERHRARWIMAEVAYEAGDPPSATGTLIELLGGISGRTYESLAAVPDEAIATFSPDLVWLSGATLASTRQLEAAERWFSVGAKAFAWDPAFPREQGALAILRRDLGAAKSFFAETQKRGDRLGAARGMAIVDWETKAARDPESLLAAADSLRDAQLFYHAGLRFDAAGDARRAVDAYTRAVQLDPLSSRSIAAAGISLHRSGQKERAAQFLQRAFEAGERSAMLLESLASIHLERGRIEEGAELLRSLVERGEASETATRNLSRATRLLALHAANEGREEDAAELLAEADAADASNSARWKATEAEVLFRAAWRALREKADGWEEAVAELSGRASSVGLTAARKALLDGLVALEQITDQDLRDKALDTAADGFKRASDAGGVAAAEALLHAQLVQAAKGSYGEADAIAQRLTKSGDPLLRLRSRWLQSLSLAKRGNPVAARVLLEESAKECASLPEAAEFLRRVRLQILKLRAEELGAKRIEREMAATGAQAASPEMKLLWGIILAGQERYDEAARALSEAAKDRTFRQEAETTRRMMQLSRVAELLAEGKNSDALRLFVRLRPTLPDELEIDLWMNALEVEGVPAAALRDGDGKPAVATWSSKIQRWRKAKDEDYWETVRSIAVAALYTAVRAERRLDYLEADQYWKIAVTRWLELLDAEEFWNAYERRGRDLFPNLDATLVRQVRDELVQEKLIGLVREVISSLRDRGDELVAASRFEWLAQIETWRLARDPGNAEIRGALAGCHAQRLIIYSHQYMFDDARRYGLMACEVEPDNPVHINNMAEMWGSEAGIAMTKLQAQYESTGPGPHLRPLMLQVVDHLSLALAWNPHHPNYQDYYSQFATQTGYTGVARGDSRYMKAAECRERLPDGVLEDYSQKVLAPQYAGETQQQGAPPAQGSAQPTGDEVLTLARKLKDAGLPVEAIYNALIGVFPQLSAMKKEEIMLLIQGA